MKSAKNSKVSGQRKIPKTQRSAVKRKCQTQRPGSEKNAKNSKVHTHRKMAKTQRSAVTEKCQKLKGSQSKEKCQNLEGPQLGQKLMGLPQKSAKTQSSQSKNAENSKVFGHEKMPKTQRSEAAEKYQKLTGLRSEKYAQNSKVRGEKNCQKLKSLRLQKVPKTRRSVVTEKCQ